MLNYKMAKKHSTLNNRGNNVCNRFSRRNRNEERDEEDENDDIQDPEVQKGRLKGSIALAAITHSCTCAHKPCDNKK